MKDLGSLLEKGQRIWVAGSANEPTGLLAQLTDMPLPDDLTFIQFPLGGYNNTDFTSLTSTSRFETFFMTRALREADPARLAFVPMQMRRVYDYLSSNVDVVLLQAAYGADGVLRIGPNVDFAAAALGCAKVVIVEINRAFVAPAGCPVLDESRISAVIETERALFEMPAPVVDEASQQIGSHVASLIKDGDCIQTGIGSIPAAILAELTHCNDLGMHGGLLDDGGMRLIRAGNITGARKPLDTGLHITGMALGSSELVGWLSETPQVVFRSADHTHEMSVIRELPGFVSINSAVEVDLFGQVNAEYAGGRQLSGTGGSVDFMRAAKASPGGRSIVAMNACARGGTVSRIVPRVELVTALRTDVDLVVTQFGIARLQGRSVAQRAAALIEIAAPEFRESLRDQIPV